MTVIFPHEFNINFIYTIYYIKNIKIQVQIYFKVLDIYGNSVRRSSRGVDTGQHHCGCLG